MLVFLLLSNIMSVSLLIFAYFVYTKYKEYTRVMSLIEKYHNVGQIGLKLLKGIIGFYLGFYGTEYIINLLDSLKPGNQNIFGPQINNNPFKCEPDFFSKNPFTDAKYVYPCDIFNNNNNKNKYQEDVILEDAEPQNNQNKININL